jgi:hypothetical protein
MKSMIIFFALILFTISNFAASIELEWVCKNDSNIAKYSLSYGKVNSPVSVTTKVSKIGNYRINTLREGNTYWFQLTPILISGGYGTPSNIITYKVPEKKFDDTHSAPQLRVKPVSKKTS